MYRPTLDETRRAVAALEAIRELLDDVPEPAQPHFKLYVTGDGLNADAVEDWDSAQQAARLHLETHLFQGTATSRHIELALSTLEGAQGSAPEVIELEDVITNYLDAWKDALLQIETRKAALMAA